MLLSTAIPIVIAAIVIVIMSRGISNKPIMPKIRNAAIKFGTTPINDKVMCSGCKKNGKCGKYRCLGNKCCKELIENGISWKNNILF